MSSFTISNLPDYSKINLSFSLDNPYDTAVLNMKIYTTRDNYESDSPDKNYNLSGLSSGDESGKDILPTDFNEDFIEFIDGIYLFTLNSYEESGGELVKSESISNKYFISYNVGVMIALDTIDVCRQLEEDDNKHLDDALWAIWGEILLIGMDRGNAVGLESNALGFLEYTKNYLNE
jgi:hypothetical protein